MRYARREIYAWVGQEIENGPERIVMLPVGDGPAVPLVATDKRAAQAGRTLLEDAGAIEKRGLPFRLVHYREVEEIDVIEP
jgi:hypothetical protein